MKVITVTYGDSVEATLVVNDDDERAVLDKLNDVNALLDDNDRCNIQSESPCTVEDAIFFLKSM